MAENNAKRIKLTGARRRAAVLNEGLGVTEAVAYENMSVIS